MNGKAQFYLTNYSAIGAVERFWAGERVTVARGGDGIGTRLRVGNRIVEAVPQWQLRYGLVDHNFLGNYCVKTGETNLSKFNLRYFDGYEYGQLTNCLPNTVEVAAGQGRFITVTVDGLSENMSGGASAYTFATVPTTPPARWRETSTLTVYGTSLLNDFTSWRFRADNGVIADVTGNVVTPADVLEGKCGYSGEIELVKSGNAMYGNIVNSSSGSIVYAFADRAASPTTKTYTFTGAVLEVDEVEVPMGLVVERVRWGANHLAVT